VAVAPPVLAGRAVVGTALAAAPGAWIGESQMAARYEWQRCAAATCVTVPGATEPVYVLGVADTGFSIRAGVEETNAVGAAIAYSTPTRLVVFR
jgi:hypothetical protein